MELNKKEEAYLFLEDGQLLKGSLIGKAGTSGGEICFNTGMTGYQEIYTDPSYYGQIVVNTHTHIGNYGALDADQESDAPKIKGLVVNEFSSTYSRTAADGSLDDYLRRHDVVGISGIDTRAIVKHIRSRGAMNAVISTEYTNAISLKKALSEVPDMNHLELSSRVTTQEIYTLQAKGDRKYRVAVLDLGVKKSILRHLTQRGVECIVFPAQTSFEEMSARRPDGYFISNGPGDPSVMDYAVHTVKRILACQQPLFGICLGHQILALAGGAKTFKMHHGHRGFNHPVKNLMTGRSEMTSKNHGFAVDKDSIEQSKDFTLTHINLNDHTVAGIQAEGKPAFSVQHHPEASPGPHDADYLFDHFIQLITKHKDR